MKASYPIQWVHATPEYILACFQEEWRQYAMLEMECDPKEIEQQLPTFATTIHQWRDLMDLVGPWELGRALNCEWATDFKWDQWRSVLEPAHKKTLLEVCELLATQAKRPRVLPAKLLGHACESAGLFLAIRSLLIQAGAPADIRPSTAIDPYLRKWPKVFTHEIARLAPGGCFYPSPKNWRTLVLMCSIAGVLLWGIGQIREMPEMVIFGIIVFVLGWVSGMCFHWPLAPEDAKTFRDLVNLILKKQRFYGFSPEEKPH